MEYYTDEYMQGAVPENNNFKKTRSGGKIVGSCFLSFFLFIFLMAIFGLIIAGRVLSPDIIEKAVRNISIEDISASIISEGKEDEKLSDYLYEEFSQIEGFKEIPKSEFEAFVDDDVLPFIADIAGDVVDSMFNDGGEIVVDADTITEIIEKSDVEYVKNIEINEEMVNDINDYLEKSNINEAIEQINDLDFKETVHFIKFFVSGIAVGVCGFFTFIFLLGIVLTNREYVRAMLMHIGIPLLIAGLLFIWGGIGLSGAGIVGLIGIEKSVAELVIIFQKALMSVFFTVGGIGAGVGAAMIIGGCFVKNKNK